MSSYFLGGDCSKGYCDFVIVNKRRTVVVPSFQLDDTFEGHQVLIQVLSDFCKTNLKATLYCGFESTGGLENNWLNQLVRLAQLLPIQAARINPNGVNKYQAASLVQNGTDAISAFYIASYMIAFPKKILYNVDDPYVSLRKQFTYIQLLKKQKNQLLNQLSILVYASFPFLVRYCKNGVPKYILTVLQKYPSPSKLARAQTKTLAKVPFITLNKAENILSVAKTSVSSLDDDISAMVIKSTVDQIIQLEKTIDLQKDFMAKNCNLPEIDLLTTIPGVGRYSAIGLMLNIVSIERFSSAKKLAAYFGLNPVYKESGDGKKGIRMSKKGRKAPRNILFMTTCSAIVHSPLIKEIYEDHCQRGKAKKSAIGVCMHKILRIVYGMLKNKTTFDAEIDLKNRVKEPVIQDAKDAFQVIKKLKVESKRRFQKRDAAAPISGRQNAKRKKKKLSQNLE